MVVFEVVVRKLLVGSHVVAIEDCGGDLTVDARCGRASSGELNRIVILD